MLGFTSKLPVTEEDRLWVDEGFCHLERLIGRQRMLEARVVLPTAEDFPDHYDRSEVAVHHLFRRVCSYMQVDSAHVELEIFADETEELREILPSWRGERSQGPAGMYLHHPKEPGKSDVSELADKASMVVAIRSSQRKDPLSLVATIAHELGHVILLGGRLLDSTDPGHEPLTDLLTVFLGMGVFTANSAAQFKQYQDDRKQGWSMRRLGYLPEQVFAYALARFAMERGERQPEWSRHLSTNVRSYFKQSQRWLDKNKAGLRNRST
jgi:hypothetical protein